MALLHAPAPAPAVEEEVLLRESFASCGVERLPDDWSSSRAQFLLWPDFAVAADAAARDGRAAVAGKGPDSAWLQSPPFATGSCAAIEIRTRFRMTGQVDAGLHLEVLTDDGQIHSVAVPVVPEDGYQEHRITLDMRSRAGSAVTVRWSIRGDSRRRPVAVMIDDVLVAGVTDRRREEWQKAMAGAGAGPIVISEIMYAPRAGEPEWLEIMNPGESPVNIAGWTISDASGSRSGSFPGVIIPARGTVVVTRDVSQFILSRGSLTCEVFDPGGIPPLNNGGDQIVLRTAGGEVLDSVAYLPAWGGAAGRSLERRRPEAPPGAGNWGECADSSGATPCAENSIAVVPVDLSLTLQTSYRFPHGESVSLVAVVRNEGYTAVQDFEVCWFIDEDEDLAPGESERIGVRQEAVPLLPGDSLAVTIDWTGARPGVHRVIVRIDAAGDGRPGNNIARALVAVGRSRGAVVVNEIMYQPLPGEPEYVELTATEPAIDLEGWTLLLGTRGDGTPEKSIPLGLEQRQGAEETERGDVEFVVVASDSSILERFGGLIAPSSGARLLVPGSALGLNNGGELIRIVDPSGGTVDSVVYGPDWHDPAFTDVGGRSLEKIQPRLDGAARQSWSTSIAPDGGTPGRHNSILAPARVSETTLHVSPNPFSPDGDGWEDHTVVAYRLGADAGYTIIRVFDVTGRLVRTLMERERGGYVGETVWDGRDDLSRRVRMGMYILHLEGYDAWGAKLVTASAVVAVAGRL